MNPYLSFSIAMCAVVIIALAGTAYLAAYFNRRSKNDMQAALEPLAQVIDGEIDVEEGLVKGRSSKAPAANHGNGRSRARRNRAGRMKVASRKIFRESPTASNRC